MLKRILILIVSTFLALALTGCDQLLLGVSILHPSRNTAIETDQGTTLSTPVVSHGGAVRDYVSLVDNLRAAGAEVIPGETLSQPFFEVTGQIIQVNGEDIQVFEFADEATVESATSQISPDGSSTGTTMITWIAPPHFYRAGKVVVLYVGDNEEVINLLVSILEPQFAGQ